ncbi:bifunctional diguanylate cyclase/phosphodiesterase [Ensifer adhaerens]|uniref:putative bifunctional diguanylate cyclase/phosphodiesterase n=1 Tax=Ensifer adhaerens TaxID=106592 RepID=UPI001CC1820A|nr:bifunctional diguanylate cyclase/phosphodiesterase [Ensifer adhaerens]MBZ7920685.1 bifunctional diguanylate cyclase/phosphodiesterase [Ensifer adhaerens]UAX93152.1 bifunctional diguanylate cyclase/phosphodiesterase [Ensifer adhaerens]UAY00789.1 bifunctional diguanylate cyclase/phosphodiesterase [Ensifer adhaerens]UAY08170.1 bifunctional diguanylate cyclase/phosphodiesterase [Ensifer adhaerens]
MNLGKRALILIFPVVLAGYLLAAVSVHVTQSRSIRALEHAKLSQRLEHAAAVFQNEIGRSKGFLNALLNGNSLRQYVSETDEDYRANALGVRLQESLKSLLDDPTGYVSLALLNSDLKTDYYFENSWDPFAQIDGAQLNLARRLIREDKLVDWTYLYEAGQRPRIVYSFFLDPVAFTRPLPSKKSSALLVQVAIQPDRFLDMQQALKKEYGSDIMLQPWPLAITDDLSASVHLGPSLYATLTVSSEHFDALMARQKFLLALGAVAMSLFSIWLIIVLIRRFITDPIAALDANVMAVMVGARDEIRDMEEKGEIGRLTENIRELHRQSVQSLKLVQRSSWTDTLTGISNRGHFNALAAGAVREAIAAGEKCSLLFIDIDNFKFVNDKHGHEIGDELLKTLAVRIGERVDAITERRGQKPAILARLSGDEFAVFVRSRPGDGTVREISAAILGLFEDGFEVSDKRYPVTASIGAAICPDDATNLAELISNADAAMYQAKTSGKNRSARFSRALHDKRTRLRQIQDELRSLDPDEQFHLVYMPMVDTEGRVTGCEALLRWYSPVLGNVTPDEFVPIAESSGLFTKIDWWVINKAMSDCGQLKALFGPETVLAINISSAELHSKAIADHFAECLERHGLEASSIEIELTETFAVKFSDQLRRNIDALRQRGFRLSIDDFGAGYTSVQQIIEYTADTIKLDRALVSNLTASQSLPVLRALIALCHAKDVAVVGEGIDTPEKLSMLTAAGCDLFQGYLISKPLPIEDLAIWALTRTARYARDDGRDELQSRQAIA